MRVGPIDNRLSLPAAVMITMINAMPDIDTTGIELSSHFALPLKNLLKTRPAVIGIMTILKISHIMSNALIWMKAPANVFISKGVKKGESIVDIAVIVTDRARFALAR